MSVCRPFFTGHIDGESLFPFPEMSSDEAETLEILRDSLRRFGRDRVDSRAIDAEDFIVVAAGCGHIWTIVSGANARTR